MFLSGRVSLNWPQLDLCNHMLFACYRLASVLVFGLYILQGNPVWHRCGCRKCSFMKWSWSWEMPICNLKKNYCQSAQGTNPWVVLLFVWTILFLLFEHFWVAVWKGHPIRTVCVCIAEWFLSSNKISASKDLLELYQCPILPESPWRSSFDSNKTPPRPRKTPRNKTFSKGILSTIVP